MGISALWGKVAALIALCGWALSAQAKYDGGSGEPNNPYQISSVPDWQELMTTPADWASHFVLTADIDLNGVSVTPIALDTSTSSGFQGTQFTGVFDGNDYVIRNADVNMPGSYYVGLFGYLGTSGQIRNLGVEDISVFGRRYVGGVVGYSSQDTIIDCHSIGGNVTGDAWVGGLVGYNSSGTVSNCFSTGSVTGGSYLGGLVGYNSSGTVSNSHSSGSVTGDDYIGGLVGRNSQGTISNSYSTGSVSGTDNYVGALVGENSSGTVSNCYSTGSVTGGSYVSGLVGYNYGGAITNCYSSGSVTGGSYVGGLVARNSDGTISHSYSTGSVAGEKYVGGLEIGRAHV
jgi:hypothetical protein